ncbi:hypothetical protein JAAARDRAFT_33109 [Jaapia argillacea MUCL 33604]|uniref:SGNH hydrolase-type esterase domain-containing protein n=1 Tax=Jaapia argillacea MUCL 33604 TaxID=933084 RepID=A0A067PXI6_9AGAM|nr:hypothetical protein JAAARDRAFT_33109 [Jaapia argillacea MUCL 33604]
MAAYVQDVIMLLGDSLTQGGVEPYGFSQRLSATYVRKLDVLNRGFGGYTTEWAIPVFEQIFAKQHEQQHVPKVRLLTIFYGANDAALAPSPQHVELPTYKSNLTKLIHMVTSPSSQWYSPETKIILIAPPPVNPVQWAEHIGGVSDRKFEVTKLYAEAVKEVGATEGLPVVDSWTGIWDKTGHDQSKLPTYLSDGLHLTPAGYEVIYDGIMKIITETYPELHPDKIRFVVKAWDEIDYKNHRQSLVIGA